MTSKTVKECWRTCDRESCWAGSPCRHERIQADADSRTEQVIAWFLVLAMAVGVVGIVIEAINDWGLL